MEKIMVVNNSVARLYKLRGNGQCTCYKCKNRCWTDWFYEYNDKVLCWDCVTQEIQEDMVQAHTESEQLKSNYTDAHIKVLNLQKEERKIIKEIIRKQNDEMYLQMAYESLFKKRG